MSLNIGTGAIETSSRRPQQEAGAPLSATLPAPPRPPPAPPVSNWTVTRWGRRLSPVIARVLIPLPRQLVDDDQAWLPRQVQGSPTRWYAPDRMRTFDRSQHRPLALLVGAVVVAHGCVHYTQGLAHSDRPSAGRAYLYGRFSIHSASAFLMPDSYPTMGFRIECADGKSYTIRFVKGPGLQVFELTPGRCVLSEIVFSDEDGGITGRRRAPPGWMEPRDFAAGKAYYLGDYEAATTREAKFLYLATETRWELTSEKNDYAATTKDLAATFHPFAGMPTEDKSFVSGLPQRALRRPPGIPSPSPQQIAQAAPLIGRTFRTFGACEASCEKGDCLAFRGPEGAATTCVVYCRSDAECPAGSACNGPSAAAQPHAAADESDPPLAAICVSAAGGAPK